jgi:hypothetical protein
MSDQLPVPYNLLPAPPHGHAIKDVAVVTIEL